MPNWCYSTINIHSKNKENIVSLQSKLNEWLDSPSLHPLAWGGESRWLGNILMHCGFPMSEVGDGVYGTCRGELTEVWENIEEKEIGDDTYYGISVMTETAWGPMLQMWVNITKKLFPDDESMDISYDAEECGCEIYWRDDENCWVHDDKEDYYLDISVYQKNEEGQLVEAYYDNEYATIDTLRDVMNDILAYFGEPTVAKEDFVNMLEPTKDKIESLVNNLDNGSYFNVYEFQYVPVEECD